MSQQPQNTSSTAQTAKDQNAPEQSSANGGAGDKTETKKLPQLSALEDDDEFEEFPAAAENGPTTLAHLAAKTGVADPSDHLWEDNWDDDDVEDAFTLQLRTAIKERQGASGGEPMKM